MPTDRSEAIKAAADTLATRLTWRDWGTKKVVQTVVKAIEEAGFEIRRVPHPRAW